jgi:SAM-dependent methyltransferase
VEDQWADAVVVAQAFHWFSNIESLREIHRVLKPTGKLVLTWNMEDGSVPWVRELRDIYEPHDANVPQYRKGAWEEVFHTQDPLLFIPFKREFFSNVTRLVNSMHCKESRYSDTVAAFMSWVLSGNVF